MQGIWITDGPGRFRRPKSKKEVRELLATDDSRVTFESTAFDGSDRKTSGRASDLAATIAGDAVHFVGPDPSTKRNFHGTISNATGSKWVVK